MPLKRSKKSVLLVAVYSTRIKPIALGAPPNGNVIPRTAGAVVAEKGKRVSTNVMSLFYGITFLGP